MTQVAIPKKQAINANQVSFKLQPPVKSLTVNYIENYVPSFKFITNDYLNHFKPILSQDMLQQIENMEIIEKYTGCDIPNFVQSGKLNVVESNTDMASVVLQNLLDKYGIANNDVDFLITVTDTGDYVSPGLSNILIARNNMNRSIRHISVSGMGCSALIKAFDIAEDFTKANPNKIAVIVISVLNSAYCQQLNDIKTCYTISEIKSNKQLNKEKAIKDWLKFTQFFLFGDAASAVLVSGQKIRSSLNLKLHNTHHLTNVRVDDHKLAYFPDGGSLNPIEHGRPSFYMSKYLPIKGLKYVRQMLQNVPNHVINKPSKWAIHTGSKKIISLMQEELKIKSSMNQASQDILECYGNITPCSLPFILEKLVSDTLEMGEQIALLGFGNGFSSSFCRLTKS